jgi:hypothetical protein
MPIKKTVRQWSAREQVTIFKGVATETPYGSKVLQVATYDGNIDPTKENVDVISRTLPVFTMDFQDVYDCSRTRKRFVIDDDDISRWLSDMLSLQDFTAQELRQKREKMREMETALESYRRMTILDFIRHKFQRKKVIHETE